MKSFLEKNRSPLRFIGASFLLLVLIVFIHSDVYSFNFSIRLPDYLYTQWVFNYDYGFVKRGFLGAVFDFLNIDPNYKNVRFISIVFIISLFFLFVKVVYDFLNKLGLDNKSVILFSVCILSLSFLTSQWIREASRFDHVGQIILLICLILILKNVKDYYVLILISILLPIMALTHEAMIIFFVPTLVYIYYLQYKKKSHVAFIALESLLLILVIILYGKMTPYQVNSIVDKFMYYRGFQPYAVSTSLLTLRENLETNISTFFSTKAYIKIFFAVLFTLPIFLFIKKSMSSRMFLTALFFAASPLALTLIAFDYIRWFALFLFNLSLIFMCLVIMKKIDGALVVENFRKFKKEIYTYATLSFFLGPIGVGNTFANYYDVSHPWERRELWDQNLLIKLNDPMPLADIQLTVQDRDLVIQFSLLKNDKLYKNVKKYYLEAAESGNSQIQNTLGFMYFYGIQTPLNYCSALDMFNKSSEQNNAYALHNLSTFYRHGICIKKDVVKANQLLIKAANNGNQTSKLLLAYNYLNAEDGFAKNKAQAVSLLNDLAKDETNIAAKILLDSVSK